MIRFVTLTGADDTTDPASLKGLSLQFPFVEWGILFSQKRFRTPRFPSKEWLEKLFNQSSMNLCLHLCGSYVRSLLKGHAIFLGDLENIDRDQYPWQLFKRVQINTHGEDHDWNIEALVAFLRTEHEHEFIFQLDGNGKNEAMAKSLVLEHGLKNVSFLFDTSHGAGLSPRTNWPSPQLSKGSFGYAGGLGPDNIAEEISKIVAIAQLRDDNKCGIWLDMETKVRSFPAPDPGRPNNDMFDLDKCRKVLERANPWFGGKTFPESIATGNGPGPDHIQKEVNSTHGYTEGADTATEKLPVIKDKAAIIDGKVYYMGGRNPVLVPEEDVLKVIAMMRYRQIEIAMEVCREQSTALVDRRVYPISENRIMEIESSYRWNVVEENGFNIIASTEVFGKKKKTGVEHIAEERLDVINRHKYTHTTDQQYKNGELVDAAIQYLAGDLTSCWPDAIPKEFYKPGDRIQELKRAGQFVAAEIDRLENTN
jgi:hypothetical protein